MSMYARLSWVMVQLVPRQAIVKQDIRVQQMAFFAIVQLHYRLTSVIVLMISIIWLERVVVLFFSWLFWQVKSFLGAERTQNSPLLSFKTLKCLFNFPPSFFVREIFLPVSSLCRLVVDFFGLVSHHRDSPDCCFCCCCRCVLREWSPFVF